MHGIKCDVYANRSVLFGVCTCAHNIDLVERKVSLRRRRRDDDGVHLHASACPARKGFILVSEYIHTHAHAREHYIRGILVHPLGCARKTFVDAARSAIHGLPMYGTVLMAGCARARVSHCLVCHHLPRARTHNRRWTEGWW